MNKLIFLGFILGVLGCSVNTDCINQKNLKNCIACNLKNSSNLFDYDYYKASTEIDKYLTSEKFIESTNKSDYANLFKSKNHLNINREIMITVFDDTFIDAPHYWGTYVECSLKNESAEWRPLAKIFTTKFDDLISDNSERIKTLDILTEDQFQLPEVKLIFQTLLLHDL